MKDLMQYKGYYGSVQLDQDEPIFHGKLMYIKALVTYEAQDAVGIKQSFEDAVDDYLALCVQESVTPERPFKGAFNIRTGHDLHEQVAIAAAREHMSINQFICTVLQKVCAKKQHTRTRR